jgi:hypothetical protein
VDETPCWKLRSNRTCYLGVNLDLDCIGCTSYDPHPEPSQALIAVWFEIRKTGTATRSDADNNPGGRVRQ